MEEHESNYRKVCSADLPYVAKKYRIVFGQHLKLVEIPWNYSSISPGKYIWPIWLNVNTNNPTLYPS